MILIKIRLFDKKLIFRNILVLFLLVLINAKGAAQDFWQETNGPIGGSIKALAVNSNGDIFAGTGGI